MLELPCRLRSTRLNPVTDRVYGLCVDQVFGTMIVIGEPGDPLRRLSGWY